MAHRVADIKSRDGISIPCGIWEGPKDAILYLHGIESHMGWFGPMAEELQRRGYCVYAFDRRGSGLSTEERGHINSYKILLSDIYDVIMDIKKGCTDRKIYLMGICGGGRFAANFAAGHQDLIDGLILISPAIKTKVALPFFTKFDVLISSFLNPKKKIRTPLRDDMFTKNERYIKFIKNDGSSLHHLTARFYRELILMDLALSKKVFNIKKPILTMLAGDDPIVDNDAMTKWQKRLRSRDKSLKVFYGCCHFLPFQENLGEIVDFVAEWIDGRRRA